MAKKIFLLCLLGFIALPFSLAFFVISLLLSILEWVAVNICAADFFMNLFGS